MNRPTTSTTYQPHPLHKPARVVEYVASGPRVLATLQYRQRGTYQVQVASTPDYHTAWELAQVLNGSLAS